MQLFSLVLYSTVFANAALATLSYQQVVANLNQLNDLTVDLQNTALAIPQLLLPTDTAPVQVIALTVSLGGSV
jgi:hypothetical protein